MQISLTCGSWIEDDAPNSPRGAATQSPCRIVMSVVQIRDARRVGPTADVTAHCETAPMLAGTAAIGDVAEVLDDDRPAGLMNLDRNIAAVEPGHQTVASVLRRPRSGTSVSQIEVDEWPSRGVVHSPHHRIA